MRKPVRFAAAQLVGRRLPPIVAVRAGKRLYPAARALRDDYPFAVRAQTGSTLQSRTGDKHALTFGIHGYNDWRLWAIALTVCSPGDSIVEIGANVGTETVGFADIVGPAGRVVAFEPYPPNLAQLEHALSRLPHGNVTVLPYAVSDAPGTVRFAPPPSAYASGQGHIVGAGEHTGDHVEVEAVTLDSLAEEIGPARLVLIDTEGAELLVLRGARSFIDRHRPTLILEASPKQLAYVGSELTDLHRELVDAGYAIRRVTRLGLAELESMSFRGYQNWLCVRDPATFDGVERTIRRCALLPSVGRLNPLSRPRAGR